MNQNLTHTEACRAWLDGKDVEYKCLPITEDWMAILKDYHDVVPAHFNTTNCTFRLAPKPTVVPWSGPDDVPSGIAWIKYKTGCAMKSVLTINDEGLEILEVELSYEQLAKSYLWSDASRKTWAPCQAVVKEVAQ